MDYKRFVDDVLRIVALLLGLTIFNIALLYSTPFIVQDKWVIEFWRFFYKDGRLDEKKVYSYPAYEPGNTIDITLIKYEY